jgi:hypothetical protein
VATGSLIATGATPAAAAKKSAPTPSTIPAFTGPAHRATVNGFCQPTVNRPCPTSNTAWSGYVLTQNSNHPFTTVSGSWVQPAVTCPKPNAWVLSWVGIDGWSNPEAGGSGTVEQGGTSVQCVSGVPQYQAWWEMYPANDVQTSYTVHVGDHMSASVVFSTVDRTYTVTVTDRTTGDSLVVVCSVPTNSYTVTVDGVTTGPTSFATPTHNVTLCGSGSTCLNASAEWIVEAPGGNGSGLYPLAHFRPVTFKSAFAQDNAGDQGSITAPAWRATALDLVNSTGVKKATVTALKKQGSSFRIKWAAGQGR